MGGRSIGPESRPARDVSGASARQRPWFCRCGAPRRCRLARGRAPSCSPPRISSNPRRRPSMSQHVGSPRHVSLAGGPLDRANPQGAAAAFDLPRRSRRRGLARLSSRRHPPPCHRRARPRSVRALRVAGRELAAPQPTPGRALRPCAPPPHRVFRSPPKRPRIPLQPDRSPPRRFRSRTRGEQPPRHPGTARPLP